MTHHFFSRLLFVATLLAGLAGPAAGATRVPNTTLAFPASPGGATTNAYSTENAYPALGFSGGPVALAVPPGETNRIFVVENGGLVKVITNLAAPAATATYLDLSSRVLVNGGEGLLGFAFHPDYASNRYVYAYYVDDHLSPPESNRYDVLSRFQTLAADANAVDPTSEVFLIRQSDEQSFHNGDDLHFGPDGYLYFSVGDEGGFGDSLNNSQQINKDFFSCIGRIDVDKRPGSLAPNPHPAVATNGVGEANYAIPPDNPFIGATQFNGFAVNPAQVRTEFYAVGLRNPWRFAFDDVSGDLYCGDVGNDQREEVNIIAKGGNYGWAYREGFTTGSKVPLRPPVLLPGNLLTNASVEQGSDSSNIDGWLRLGNANVYRDPYTAFGYTLGAGTFPDGERGLKGFGNNSRLTQSNLVVTGSATYVAGGFFYHSSVTDVISAIAHSTRMSIVVDWQAADGASLGAVTATTHNGLSFPDTWLESRINVTSPATATRASYSIAVSSTNGVGSLFGDLFYFGDGTNLPPLNTAGNLLGNPSIESGIDTDFPPWVRDDATSTREDLDGFGYSLAAGTFPDGRHALKEYGAGSDVYQTNLPVAAGSNYLARSLFYHSSTEDAIAVNGNSTRMFITVDWFDTNGVSVGSFTTATHNGLSPANAWTVMQVTNAAPAAAATAAFHVRSLSDVGSGSVWVDTLYFGIPPVPSTNIYAGLNLIDPVHQYAHGSATNQGYSITGGIVYRGDRFPELVGRYLFADFISGNIWSLLYDGTNASGASLLANDNGIVGFGVDPRNGDVLMAEIYSSEIRRLERNVTSGPLPQNLADAGVFSNLQALAVEPGLVPYEINVPFWSDYARKTRWFCVPDTNATIDFNAEGNWTFPTGTVWIKHFDLDLVRGDTSTARRLETRALVKNEGGVYGVTYRWGNSSTNAELVSAEGLDEAFVVDDGGVIVTQVWHYPSRAECLTCHTPAAGHALGFNTPQLNLDTRPEGYATNQIRYLGQCGYFSSSVSNLHLLRALAPATNTAYSLDYRARSYLQANCGQCHIPNGPAHAMWNANIFTPLSAAFIVDGALDNDLGEPLNRVIAPGDAFHSVMLKRISTPGALRMPPLASNMLDTNAIALITAWVGSLSGYQSFAGWQVQHFGSSGAPDAASDADPDLDGAANRLEWLTGTDPTNSVAPDGWGIDLAQAGDGVSVGFDRLADRAFEVQYTTNLTESAWRPLDVAGNEPVFVSTSRVDTVQDSDTNRSPAFYRVRVLEP